MTQDNGLDVPTDDIQTQWHYNCEGVIEVLQTAIDMLPIYNDPAWTKEPDNTKLDVGYCREVLKTLKRNLENGPTV